MATQSGTAGRAAPGPPPPTENSGWVAFAAILLMINGIFAVLYGLAAILNDKVVTVGGRGVMIADLTTWGWITLVIGVIALLTGWGLFIGNTAARFLAIAFASLQAIAQFGVVSAFPLWSILIIAIDIIIIYHLTVRWVPHGELL